MGGAGSTRSKTWGGGVRECVARDSYVCVCVCGVSPLRGSGERHGCSLWKGKMSSPCFSEPCSPAERRANREEGLLQA